MSNHSDYHAENTNIAKNKAKLSKIVLIATYLGIWAFALLTFWFFISTSDAMGYSLVFLWIVLPVSAFVLSLLIGKNNYWGKLKWTAPVVFGIMHMLAEYVTFSVKNMIAISFTRINAPHFELILIGGFFSVIGLCIGNLVYHIKSNSRKK